MGKMACMDKKSKCKRRDRWNYTLQICQINDVKTQGFKRDAAKLMVKAKLSHSMDIKSK